jgi:hypothetical protein
MPGMRISDTTTSTGSAASAFKASAPPFANQHLPFATHAVHAAPNSIKNSRLIVNKQYANHGSRASRILGNCRLPLYTPLSNQGMRLASQLPDSGCDFSETQIPLSNCASKPPSTPQRSTMYHLNDVYCVAEKHGGSGMQGLSRGLPWHTSEDRSVTYRSFSTKTPPG